MFKPRDVTLYVPCYNAGGTITKLLQAVADQTVTPKEVVLIDDGSDPPLHLPGWRVVRHAANYGLAAARNTALSLCRTPLLAALDADVAPAPDWLEILLTALNRSGAAGVGGRLDEHFKVTLGDRWRIAHMTQHWGDRSLRNPRFLYGANTLLRAQVLRDAGGYDPALRTNNEDRVMSETLYAHGASLVYVPGARCRHLRRDDCRTILPGYWRWHYASGLQLGDFDRPAGMVGRISLVNFGISRYRAYLDRREQRPSLLGLDTALPWVFCAMDLWFYAQRHRVSLPDFPPAAAMRRLPGPVIRLLLALLEAVPDRPPAGPAPIWLEDYLVAFEECLERFNWWYECEQPLIWDDLAAELAGPVD
ncbi:MAG: glycosyltransferase family 2 protein [Kiritimatiellia bacterium]|nr:glycosyltransferase [Lentisphaerota bacterium]